MRLIIADKYEIGPECPTFIIAEAGVNHNGDLGLAHRLVDVAVRAKADAIKFQTFKADRLVTRDAPKAAYQLQATDAAESQYDMLRQLELSQETHRDLITYCREKGILFMSTPFDEASAELLAELGVPIFKIPSGEITNLPFLAHVACKGKPMIVSTGMANLGEVEAAVNTIVEAGNAGLILLHCVSNYPADPADVNLRAMQTMATAFGVPVGYSDHTSGIEVALAAVALGASVIEKHLTLDRNLPGPDHLASLEPDGLSALVKGVRTVEAALGNGKKAAAASENDTALVARKSLVAACDISAGTILTRELIVAKRPGTGLSPALLDLILGKQLRQTLRANEPVRLTCVE